MSVLLNTFLYGSAVSPPVFVSKSEQDRGSGATAMTVTAPTSITDGNVLYLCVVNNNSGAAAATCTGFSQIFHDSSAAPTVTILKKTAASESGSYSVASTTSANAAAQMLNYAGGYGSEDVVGTVDRSGGTTDTLIAPSITVTVAGVLLAFFYTGGTDTVLTPPSGMTQRAFKNTNRAMATYELAPSPTGATGTKTLVFSASHSVHSATLMQIK